MLYYSCFQYVTCQTGRLLAACAFLLRSKSHSMNIDRLKTVAFTGYRTEKIIRSAPSLNIEKLIFEKTLEVIKTLYEQGYNTFLCGMAQGFDMLAAEATLRAKEDCPDIKLIAVIPFMGQELGYGNTDKERYNRIFENSSSVEMVSNCYSEYVYFKRNDYLLKNSSLLVCYYSGLRGGTMYTVNRAIRARMPIINIFKLMKTG